MMKANFVVVFSTLALLIGLNGEAKILLKSGAPSALSNFGVMATDKVNLYILEWNQPIKESHKADLVNLGVKVISYIPENSFLVSASGVAMQAAKSLGFVSNIYTYDSALRIEAELTNQTQGIFSQNQVQRVTVVLVPNFSVDAEISNLIAHAVKVGKFSYQASLRLEQIWNLSKSTQVVWIEKAIPLKILDFNPFADGETPAPSDLPAATGFESGTKILNVQTAYDNGFHGEGMITGFADTGLDTGESSTVVADFKDKIVTATNIALFGTTWGDPNGHGTHVAGSIAGNGAMSNGAIRGGAYEAKFVVQGMWSDMFNNIFPPEMSKIFTPAYKDGARLHSNSWGGSAMGKYDNNAAEVDRFMFENQEFLAIFAAGNDGKDSDANGVIDEGSLATPGSAKNIVTVGASKNYILDGGIQKSMKDLREGAKKWGAEPLASSKLSEDAKGMAAFSSRGPAADGRIKPDVVAPGTNIVSVKSTHPKADATNGAWGKDYVFLNGTSMATPVTNGALTLMRQILLDRTKATTVSAALIKATAIHTAEDLFPGQFGSRGQGQEQPTPRPNNHEGFGRVDVAKLFDDRPMKFIDERIGLATGQERFYDMNVKDAQKSLHITLCYTDAPGSTSSARALVNDLDLIAIDPAGKRVFPNRLAAKDAINNCEDIEIAKPLAGAYSVSVKAANIPQGVRGSQPYALVVSGGI